jgi:transketolase
MFTRPDGRRAPVDIAALDRTAALLRGRIIETSGRAGVPHLGSCLSCVDILTALYWGVLEADPADPGNPGRDRFILSKGHAAPALFQLLALKGYFPESLLDRYGEDGTLFGEHPPAHGVPGVEAATGSLGHGLPMGVGMAIGSRLLRQENRVHVLMSDGECNEGSVWEAAMMAGAQRLERLAVIIDFNKWQATGRSEEVLALNPLAAKWETFGWRAREADGHDIGALVDILRGVPDGSGKPVAIIAHTIKGKGVSFMEDDNNWHYRIPTPAEVAIAKTELGLS